MSDRSNNENSICFIDSNIWLYAFTSVAIDNAKRTISQDLINSTEIYISTQVVNEVCSNLIKKSSLSELQIRTLIDQFYSDCHVKEVDQEVLLTGSKLRGDYSLSYWDSLIVAAALSSGVSVLYSEDMQHGLVINGCLMIVNPFV